LHFSMTLAGVFDALLTMRTVSSMKAKLAMVQCSFEIAQMNEATKLSFCMMSKSGELTVAQICGPALLPCPILAIGACQVA